MPARARAREGGIENGNISMNRPIPNVSPPLKRTALGPSEARSSVRLSLHLALAWETEGVPYFRQFHFEH